MHPKDQLKLYAIPLEGLISDVPRTTIGFIGNMKSKMMIGIVFVLFVTNVSALDSVSYIISVLIESYTKIRFSEFFLTFTFLVFEGKAKFHYYLLLTRQI